MRRASIQIIGFSVGMAIDAAVHVHDTAASCMSASAPKGVTCNQVDTLARNSSTLLAREHMHGPTSLADAHGHTSLANGPTSLANKRTGITGHQTHGHHWPTNAWTSLANKHMDITGQQIHGHHWPTSTWTSLANKHMDITGQQAHGHHWPTSTWTSLANKHMDTRRRWAACMMPINSQGLLSRDAALLPIVCPTRAVALAPA
jgi:hypothetical protein